MSEEVTSETAEAVEEVAAETESAQVAETGADELAKWKAMARKNEEAAKRNAEKAAEFDKWQESQKSESEKSQARIAELEKQLAEREARLLRSKVAAEKGLEPELAETLQGDSEEDMAEHADRLIAAISRRFAPKVKPAPEDTGAGATGGSVQDDPLALAEAVRRR